MVLAGLDVQDVVSSSAYGLNAKVKFNGWKKV